MSKAYELVNSTATIPVIFATEHASNALPEGMDLGLSEEMMRSHNAYDAHARDITLACAEKMKATALLSVYSRLLIDVNRQLGAANLIRDNIEGEPIPANVDLSEAEVNERIEKYYKPYFDMGEVQLERLQKESGTDPITVSIHTFTRHHEAEDKPRPWDIGLLYAEDERVSDVFSEYFTTTYPELSLGFNEPYSLITVPMAGVILHGRKRNLPTFMIEICDDLVTPERDINFWSDLIVDVLQDIHEKI